MKPILAPSLLAADFANLKSEITTVAQAGASMLHLDVMDGCFVPNISFGIPVIKSIRPLTGMTFDVHLMVQQPERYIAAFAEAGADMITVHAEACADVHTAAAQIRRLGKHAAVAIKPHTPPEQVYDMLPTLDMVLIMSVEPGFGGQGFLPDSLRKAENLAGFIARERLPVVIEMDGGIGLHNVRSLLSAGVNVVVAGSTVFGAADIAQAVRDFNEIFADCLCMKG